MKSDDRSSLTQALRQLLAGPLADPAAIHLAAPAAATSPMRHGFHSHDAWELFCPLRASLRFVLAGQPPCTIAAGHLLIVPPGCLHLAVDRLAQPAHLRLLVLNLPGAEGTSGGLTVGRFRQRGRETLSPAELAAWAVVAGAPPGALLEQVAHALTAGAWGRERALGLLRILMAACAEVISHPPDDPLSPSARRVAAAQLFLQSHYYEPKLSAATVAGALGLSASHLGALFRKTTGHTLHQTLIDLRLRRATDLLRRTNYPIKQIATLTGWSNQLYFSAAYRHRHGRPPSAVRHGGRLRQPTG